MGYSALMLAGRVVVVALVLPCASAGSASDAVLRGAVNKSVPVANASKVDMKFGASAHALVDPNSTKPMPGEGGAEHSDAVVTVTVAVGIGKIATWLIAHKAAFVAAGALVETFHGMLKAGALAGDIVGQVIDNMKPSREFTRQVGSFGLPLTVAVVNDSPVNMRIVRHEVMEGSEFSYSSEGRNLAPGDEAKWEAYTNWWGTAVRISIEVEFDDAEKTHAIINAAKLRGFSSWGCDSLRGGDVLEGRWGDRSKYQDALCKADRDVSRSGNPYQLAFFVPA